MSQFAEVRLTIAAYIYAIENDLKTIVESYIVPIQTDFSFFGNPELVVRTKERFAKENVGVDADKMISDVVEYLDFIDILQISLKNKNLLPARTEGVLTKIAPSIEKIAPIRNRTMHTRPLHYGDFSTVHSFLIEVKEFYRFVFPSAVIVLEKIESDPTYILTLELPYFQQEENVVSHNLPMPDFDETGLIGRQKDIEELKNLILRNQVVTLIGTGGVGKSALMLKVVYDIIDMNKQCPFDVVIWVSAKTTALTARGIEEIKDALADYSKIVGKIADYFDKPKMTVEENIETIMEYLDVFKVLLIIDNLETIQMESISEFIKAAQMKCKIAITSRIGLGELEYRRALNGLSGGDSAKMIRELASIKNNRDIERMPQSALIEIGDKLHNNPLAIKWLVNSVALGKNPNDVLAKKEHLLEFCLSNVYDKLTDLGLEVLKIIRSARRPLSEAEVIFLSEMPPLDCRRGIMDLLTTTFVVRDMQANSLGSQMIYRISEFPNEYLLKHHPIASESVRAISKKPTVLNESVKDIQYNNNNNEFDLRSTEIRNSEEKIASKFLMDALSLSRRGEFDEALKKIEDVKGIAPNYFELYKISGFIKASNDDVLGAEYDYQIALELEPNDVGTLYYYARFLLFIMQDADSAAPYADTVFKLRPDQSYTNLLKAQMLEATSDFSGAIKILSEYIELKAVKSSKEMRIAISEAMSCCQSWAQRLINYDQNYKLAAEKLMASTTFYDIGFNVQNVDKKMSDKLAKSLSMMVSSIPRLVTKEYLETILRLHSKYSDHMALSEYYPNLIRILSYVFDIQVSKSYLLKEGNESREKGIVIKYSPDRPYAFIESNGENYFAKKNSFTNIWDWDEVHNGAVVVFDKRPSTVVGKSPTAVNVVVAFYEHG